MRVQPFEDRSIEEIALSRFDDALLDVQGYALAPDVTLEKILARDRAGDEADRRWRDWCESLEIAAAGRSGQPERLRTERTADPDDPDAWVPGMDPNHGLTFGKASGSIRDKGEPNSVRKLADGTVLQFDSAGKVSACFPDGSAPDEIVALLQE